ncbi:hypothetical protein PR048_013750 [Dryococelus australis]|uniref:Uncharacterized protein n=1 Tax=Dryococelus australis TaxID=614101 RepID=A0ABQ9HT22_9NEOP|nr:hypothetical protein PR048_013750 [Dryococelus australis]
MCLQILCRRRLSTHLFAAKILEGSCNFCRQHNGVRHPSHCSPRDVECGGCCACSSCLRHFVEPTGTPEVLGETIVKSESSVQWKSRSSSASYAPPGTFDFEDIATEILVPGKWRADGMPTGTMLRLKRVPKKPTVLGQEIREEFVGYFTSTEGGECGQDKLEMRDTCAESESSLVQNGKLCDTRKRGGRRSHLHPFHTRWICLCFSCLRSSNPRGQPGEISLGIAAKGCPWMQLPHVPV